MTTACRGSSGVVRLLLSKGAPTSPAHDNGFAAPIACAQSGDVATARLLIDAGADEDAATMEGDTPLCMWR